MIPELADRLTYTKDTYYADVGDFGAVGSIHVDYRNAIADQAQVADGEYGLQRLFTAGTQAFGDGHLLEGVEVQHYDGPFANPDDQRKENAPLSGFVLATGAAATGASGTSDAHRVELGMALFSSV